MTTISPEAPAVPAPPGRRGLIQAVRRLGWGVMDQGISSLSNFALGLFVARSFGASNFGAFTLAYITYTVVLNAARGLSTDPLLVRYSGDASRRWHRATSAATGTALLVGIAAGSLCIVAGLLLPSPLGPVFVALGVGLPGLVLQDSFRFAFFATGRGFTAFINDLFWTVLLVLGLVVLHTQGDGSAARCLLVFGGTAALAALLGGDTGESPATPRPRAVVASGPPPNIGSLPRREPLYQRSRSDALVRARRGSRPRGCRLRASFRDLDGPLPRRPHGNQPGGCSRSLTRVPPELQTPRTLLFRSWWFSGCRCRGVGIDPHHGLPPRSWARPTQGALDANCHNYFRPSPLRSPRPRSPLRQPRDCVPWV